MIGAQALDESPEQRRAVPWMRDGRVGECRVEFAVHVVDPELRWDLGELAHPLNPAGLLEVH